MKLFLSFCISFAVAYDHGCGCDWDLMQEWENAAETWKSDFKSMNEKHNVCSIRFKKIILP